MSKPAALKNTRHLLTYIPRDESRIQERRLIGGWSGHFEIVDVQLEMFSDSETGADCARTELVEVAVDSFGTGPAYRIADLAPELWVKGIPDCDLPRPVAYLSDTGHNPAYPREWRTDESIAREVVAELAV